MCRRQKLTWKPQFQVPFPHLPCSSRWVRARPPYHRVLFSSVSFPPSFLFPSRVRALRLSLSLETAFPRLGAGPEKQWLECGQRRAENWSLILSSAQQLSLCPPRAATMLKRKASYLQQLAREKWLNNHVSELCSPRLCFIPNSRCLTVLYPLNPLSTHLMCSFLLSSSCDIHFAGIFSIILGLSVLYAQDF